MNEGSLGIHQVELVIQAGPSLSDGSGVGQHAHGSLDLGKISTRNHSWRLVVDANLKKGKSNFMQTKKVDKIKIRNRQNLKSGLWF